MLRVLIAQDLMEEMLPEATERHAECLAAIYLACSYDLDVTHLGPSSQMVSQGTMAEVAQLCARVDGCSGCGAMLGGLDIEADNSPLVIQYGEPGDYCRGGPALCRG